MKFLVAPDLTPDAAAQLAISHGCAGYYLTLPPVWQVQAEVESWTFPCVVTMTDEGGVASWEPV